MPVLVEEKAKLSPETKLYLNGFIEILNKDRMTDKGSYFVAEATLVLIKNLITQSEWNSAKELMTLLKQEGKQLVSRAGMSDTIVGNLIRRVLKLIREEYRSCFNQGSRIQDLASHPEESKLEGDPIDSLHNMVTAAGGQSDDDYSKVIPDFKGKLLQTLEELATELESSSEEISEQALEHIHTNEVILTIGRSRIVELFLKHAAKKGREFQVIVAECAPSFQGQAMAVSLAEAKIPTTVITDSAVFAMMSRVNKVIIGAHAIVADGGLQAVTGTHTVALAAKHYSVPLVVCAPMYKLTPVYYTAAADQDNFHKFVSPAEILRGMDGKILSSVHAYNPVFEYVPPDLVTLFISNISGMAPSYIYRQLSEYYHPDDYKL